MSRWSIEEQESDIYDVFRSGRSFAFGVTIQEALRRIKKSPYYKPEDKIIEISIDGHERMRKL